MSVHHPANSPPLLSSPLPLFAPHSSVPLTKCASTSWASPSAMVSSMSPHRYVPSVTYTIYGSVYGVSAHSECSDDVTVLTSQGLGIILVDHSVYLLMDAPDNNFFPPITFPPTLPLSFLHLRLLPHRHLFPSSSPPSPSSLPSPYSLPFPSYCLQEATYAEYAYTHGLIPLEAKLKAERYHQKCSQKVLSCMKRM